MTWPVTPGHISEIPHSDWDDGMIENMPPVAARGLLEALPLIADLLELVTRGDEHAEKTVGGALLRVAEQIGLETTIRRI